MPQWSIWLVVLGAVLWGAGYVLVKRSVEQRKLAQVLFAVGCLAMLPAVGFGVSGEVQKRTPQAVNAQQDQDAPKAKSLGFTVAEFKDRLNQSAKRMGVKFRADDPVVSSVKADDACESFHVALGDNLGMVGNADKTTHALTGFILLLVSDGNTRSQDRNLAQMLVSSMVLVDMCNPGLAKEQLEGVLRELGLLGGQTKAEKRDFAQGEDFIRSAQLGQVRYSFRMSPAGRAYFTADPL